MSTFIISDFTSTDTAADLVKRLYFSDTFTRPDSDTVGQGEVGGLTWNYAAGSYRIINGALTAQTATNPIQCWVDPGLSASTVSVKPKTLGVSEHAGIMFRGNATAAYVYYARRFEHVLAVRTAADAYTIIPPTATQVAWTSGETMSVAFDAAGRIICRVNGYITHDVTHTGVVGTRVGVSTRAATTADPTSWDDFTVTSTIGI